MFKRTYDGGTTEPHIVFDGGYNCGLGFGTWAVVFVYKGKEILLDWGHEHKSTSSGLEFSAARKAREYATRLGVDIVYGDYQGCLRTMSREEPSIDWRWVPSKNNVADKYTKQ